MTSAARRRRERAQDAVEYALLVTLIALGITAGMVLLSSGVGRSYGDAATCVTAATSGAPGTGSPPGAGKGKGGGVGAPGQGKGKGKGKGRGGTSGAGTTVCP